MLSNQYIFPTKFFRHIINTTTIRVFTEISPPLPWRLQNTGRWHTSMPFGMLLLLCYNFGQKTSISLPLALPQNASTPPSSRHLPATHYVNYQKILFGCFVIALTVAFTQQLSLADEGYKSGSDTVDLPTPLRKIPHIHHVSSMENASFNPAHTTPCSAATMTPCS